MEFSSEDDMRRACELSGQEVHGKHIRVAHSQPPAGGFGGRGGRGGRGACTYVVCVMQGCTLWSGACLDIVEAGVAMFRGCSAIVGCTAPKFDGRPLLGGV